MRHIINPLSDAVVGVIAFSPKELETILNTYTLPSDWTVVTRGTRLVVVGRDGGEIFLPEFQAILDYGTSQAFAFPSTPIQAKGNTFIANCKDAGVWDTKRHIYVLRTDGDSGFSRIDWKNPGLFNAILGTTAPTFTPNVGFTSIPNSYLDMNFLEDADLANNVCLAVGSPKPTVTSVLQGCQTNGGSRLMFNLSAGVNLPAAILNSTAGINGVVDPSFDAAPGLYQFIRESASGPTGMKIKKNAGVEFTANADPGSGLVPGFKFFLFAYNADGVPILGNSGITIDHLSIGTQGDATKRNAFNTAWQTYLS